LMQNSQCKTAIAINRGIIFKIFLHNIKFLPNSKGCFSIYEAYGIS